MYATEFEKCDEVRSSFHFKIKGFEARGVINSSWFTQDFPGIKPGLIPGKSCIPGSPPVPRKLE